MIGIGYTCKYHNIAVPNHNACEQCMAERETLPAVEDMTLEQRAAEFEMWINRDQLTVDWAVFKMRLEALLGRGIWTHELSTEGCKRLIQEARTLE